jgi:uncharacterized protein
MPPKTERFEMRMDADMLAAIDRWRKNMGDMPRSEAIRTLVRIGLVAKDVTFADIAAATDRPSKPKKRR